ncbi:MAG: ABC transporter ATP-binding protein [Candidatus Dormibacteria bacterium]
MPAAEAILTVSHVSHSFGGFRAVDDCSFEIAAGSISALIGPNGAGKSTLVGLIGGAMRTQTGSIHFAGRNISRMSAFKVARLGLLRTYQVSREFAGLTVMENLLVPPPNQRGESLFNALFRPSLGRVQDRELADRAFEVLETFGLLALRDEYAGNLSGGEKRLLELARAVMAEPKFMLLDEPMAGINPALIARLDGHIRRLRDDHGITFLLVEHNLDVVERICDRVVVMAFGRTLAEGQMSELRENPEVVRAYLGGGLDERAAG